MRLFRILDIHKHEAGRLLLMSAYLLLVIASYSTIKAVRDSLFVTKIGPAQLPYMYLLIAGAMGLVSYAYSMAVHRTGLRRLVRTTSIIAISNLLLFWFAFRTAGDDSRIWFYVLYVWVSLFGAITASQCWLLATHVFNPREARRVFPWIGVGGILGGIAGGALTRIVAPALGTESLLAITAIMMGITIVLLQQIAKSHETIDSEESVPAGAAGAKVNVLAQVRSSRHLSMLVLFLAIAVTVEAFVDFEYKSIAKQFITSKDDLTSFFGTVTFYIGIVALAFQMVLTSRILKRFGVGVAIALLPAGLFIASVNLAVTPVLWAVAVLQIIDGAFSYSIHRSGMELLFLPVPPQVRNSVKGFIDMFVDRLGRAVGGLLLLLLTAVLAISAQSLSIIVAVMAIAWLALAFAVRHEYLHSFRVGLEKKSIEPEALNVEELDHATVATLVRRLASDDEREILYAIDLLANTNPSRWRRHIQELIRHPSAAVRARAIAVLARWNDAAITRNEFVRHPDYLTARIATASALSLHWTGSPRAAALLEELLRDPSPDVARQAIRTAGVVKYEGAIPFLISTLADKRLRADARESLLRYERKVLPELVRRLASEEEPLAVRIRIPKVLALTGRQRAADALMIGLRNFDHHLNYAVLKALNKLRAGGTDIVVDRACVMDLIERERQKYEHLRSIRMGMAEHAGGQPVELLLKKAVRERLQHGLERIFRLVALIHAPQDIYSIYHNLKTRPALRASAVEFLDNLLDPELKRAIVPLIEETFDPDAKYKTKPAMTYASRDAVLRDIIAGSDPWLRRIALHLGPYAERRKAG